MGRDVVDIPLGSSPRRLRDEKQNFLSGRGLVLSHILCNDTRYVVSPQAGIRRSIPRRRARVRCLSVGNSRIAVSYGAKHRLLLAAPRAVFHTLCRMGGRFFPCGSLWPAHTAFPKSARRDDSLYADHQHSHRSTLLLFDSRVRSRAEDHFAPLSYCFVWSHIFLAYRPLSALAQPSQD